MRLSSDSRRIHSNGISDAVTVSLAVDNVQKSVKQCRSPGRAWPGENDMQERNNICQDQVRMSNESTYYTEVTNLFV